MDINITEIAKGIKKKFDSSQRKKSNSKERRIVILNQEKCKPKSSAFSYLKKYAQGCGKACIQVVGTSENQKIEISEEACNACILRANRCPGDACTLVKIPTNLDMNTTHCYGKNQFKLCGLPMPFPNKVLGILGINGIGKTTVLEILMGKLKPNLGYLKDTPSWKEIVSYYRGSSLQNYFLKIVNNELVPAFKKQSDSCNTTKESNSKITIFDILRENDELDCALEIANKLGLDNLLDHELSTLSGGEKQRLAIVCTASKNADVYIFDEPSSYLDVEQRLASVQIIRNLCQAGKYVIVVDHDLSILDAVSDQISCMFGEPGAYGIVTQSMNPAEAINQFLSGYFPSINMRFRSYSLDFSPPNMSDDMFLTNGGETIQYEEVTIKLGDTSENSFTLNINPGEILEREIVGILGVNGCGKSTLMSYFSKEYLVSYKQQHNIELRKFKGNVSDLLEHKIGFILGDRMFGLLVLKPLKIESMYSYEVRNLSGGELQRLAITICLGTPASVYLLDEPCAGLDCEQRLIVTKTIKKWVTIHLAKSALIIEHDLLMAATLFNRVIGFTGIPGIKSTAFEPIISSEGINYFLKSIDITMRVDKTSGRPRINKKHSTKDNEQKKSNMNFLEKSSQKSF